MRIHTLIGIVAAVLLLGACTGEPPEESEPAEPTRAEGEIPAEPAAADETGAGPMSQAMPDGPLSLDDVPVVTVPPLDVEGAMAEDVAAGLADDGEPGPMRFAVPHETELDVAGSGVWFERADGSRVWQLRIRSEGAQSLNLGMTRFEIPEGAEFWVYDPDQTVVQGPFGPEDATRGQLWTPVVLGEEIVLELIVPPDAVTEPVIEITSVNRGYRGFEPPSAIGEKQGSCNIDVVCQEGDGWRDLIRAVAKITLNGQDLCTGNLMNNTSGDFTPYLLTAFHCEIDNSNDASIVVYWNHESPNCGDLSGGSLTDAQTGSTLRSSYEPSDFTLVELTTDPDPGFDVFFSGWDATGNAASSSVTIHHPSGDEKAISFENDPVTSTDWGSDTADPAEDHWRVADWDSGTTELGSSGACLWDVTSRRCVGQLHGGAAKCGNDEPDWYGKFSTSWTGGGTAATRLQDWLDPAGGGGQTTLDGAEAPNDPPSADLGQDVVADEGDLVTLEVQITDGDIGDEHRVTWSWGDGSTDVVTTTNGSIVATFGSPAERRWGDNGVYTVSVTVEDLQNGVPTGDSATDTLQLTVINVDPAVEMPVIDPPLPWPGQSVNLTAEFGDPGWLDTHTAEVDWGVPPTSPGTVAKNGLVWNEVGTVEAERDQGFAALGQQQITLCVEDDDGGSNCADVEIGVDMSPLMPGVFPTANEHNFLQWTGALPGTIAAAESQWRNGNGVAVLKWIYESDGYLYFFQVTANDVPNFEPDPATPSLDDNWLAFAVPTDEFQTWLWCGLNLPGVPSGCHPDYSPPPYGAGELHPWIVERIEESRPHIDAVLQQIFE